MSNLISVHDHPRHFVSKVSWSASGICLDSVAHANGKHELDDWITSGDFLSHLSIVDPQIRVLQPEVADQTVSLPQREANVPKLYIERVRLVNLDL